MKRKKLRKESFMKSVVVLMISQVFVKALGLVYKLYLTFLNKEEKIRQLFSAKIL